MNIAVFNTSIRQDSEGRYSLNDLHAASGGEDRHLPNRWTRVEATKKLIECLNAALSENDADVNKRQKWPIVTKQRLGTFVCLELVYDYAAWISPEFKLEVYRTFHALRTAPQPVASPPRDTTLLDAKRKAQAIDISLNCVDRLLKMFPDLGEAGRRTLVASLINPIIGMEALPLPRIAKLYSATEVGEMVGLSANGVGRLANELGIKTEGYGEMVLSKSKYSDKQVEQWLYNEDGLAVIRAAIKASEH